MQDNSKFTVETESSILVNGKIQHLWDFQGSFDTFAEAREFIDKNFSDKRARIIGEVLFVFPREVKNG